MSKATSQEMEMDLPSTHAGCLTVLYVDDDALSPAMAEEVLVRAGFRMLFATNVLEAVEVFKSQEPDLLITNTTTLDMDGFDSIEAIRSLNEHVPILVITELDDLTSISRAYDLGATDFLTKPVNFIALPHRIRYLMRAKFSADVLRSSEAKLGNAQRIARVGNWEWDLKTHLMTCSVEFCSVLGLQDSGRIQSWQQFLECIEESDRHNLRLLAEDAIELQDPFNIEFSVRAEVDDSLRRIRLEAEPNTMNTGGKTFVLGTIQDITERTKSEKQIHDLAYYDLVTGLPNRAQLNQQLHYTLQLASRNDTKFALLFLDLDHFKQVNDTLGHDAGDELLKQVSTRLTSVIREADIISASALRAEELGSQHTVARLGGDEFVVLLGQIARPEDAARVAERIGHKISEMYDINGHDVSVTTTIGISVYPSDGDNSESLMKSADVAMYHAKESGRNGYQFYSRDIHEKALARFSIEKELRQAIEDEDLTIVYQPKICFATGSVIGVEALVRWKHAQSGWIKPDDFIPLAEETGLILPLGRWVMCTAAKQMKGWVDEGMTPLTIAVNCSSVQFKRGDMTKDIQDALTVSELDPRYLEIEITESLLMHEFEESCRLLQDMKELGVQVSIDDFGTGFSSLSYLKNLPVDKLKIDKSFVENLHTDAGDVAIVSAIITLSHHMNLSVVAEGVETEEQFAVLRNLKCNEGQGYLFGKPMEANVFREWIAEFRIPDLKYASDG